LGGEDLKSRGGAENRTRERGKKDLPRGVRIRVSPGVTKKGKSIDKGR